LREHSAEFALAGAGSLPLDSAAPALSFRGPHRDLDAVHQHIHLRDVLFGNNGQNELFGAVDFPLIARCDRRTNGLRGSFDSFGGDFQARQYLHRLAGRCERHL